MQHAEEKFVIIFGIIHYYAFFMLTTVMELLSFQF